VKSAEDITSFENAMVTIVFISRLSAARKDVLQKLNPRLKMHEECRYKNGYQKWFSSRNG